ALNLPVGSLTAANGRITGGGAFLTYGALADSAAKEAPPPNPPLIGTGQYIGVSVPRSDIPVKVNGKAVFGIDVRLPGMVYAAIQNAPVVGATLTPGMTIAAPTGTLAAVALDTAVAVVAKDTYTAMRAARNLKVNWSIPTGNNTISSAGIMTQAQQLMTTGPVMTAETVGLPQGALLTATKALDLTYNVPYLAHACMEVLNCTALVTPTSCTVWAPTQAQTAVVATAAAVTGLPVSAITVNTTFLGGGLGRKIEQDFISQAIRTAKAMSGTPVKLTWSREQDFAGDQFRPMALARVQAGLDAAGNIVAWWTRLVAPSYSYQHGGKTGVDFLAITGATALPYAFTHRLVEYVRHTAPVAVGSWRSIGCSINTFVTESALDELALAAGVDPLAFRQRLLAGNPRALAVLNAAASLGDWATPPAAGRARGIAFCFSDNSYVAMVVEVSQPTTGTMKVHAVACAVDCGMAVNPDSVTAQIEGGIVHGLSSALWGQVAITGGRANVSNFDSYRMMRMRDMPVVKVQIIDGAPASLGGAGEVSVPPVAPALANAWAKLTGQRLRSLPLFPRAGSSGGGENSGRGNSNGGSTSGSGESRGRKSDDEDSKSGTRKREDD
ncbi:MAG: xanthine dehydrogenase family protein molybdopterin-binding subunit, partial [Rhodospirillaceae bacterium]